MAGIQLASNFDLGSQIPLDSRTVVNDVPTRDAISSSVRYEGLTVYVKSEQTNYQLIGGIDNINWQEFSGAGGEVGSDSASGKALLVNDSVNTLNEIGEYLANCPGIIVDYYIYRKTDSETRRMTGRIRLETLPDEAISADRWTLLESLRSEVGTDSGVTFSLTEVDTEKSVLVATLDDMPGTNHTCKFYYKLTKFNNATGKIVILDNNSINPISAIGEYVDVSGCVIIDYFIYRKTDLEFKTLSGKIFIEGNKDAVLDADKWDLFEADRSENPVESGITFSLDSVDTGKSILVITLDNMAGSDHECDFYYVKTVLKN